MSSAAQQKKSFAAHEMFFQNGEQKFPQCTGFSLFFPRSMMLFAS